MPALGDRRAELGGARARLDDAAADHARGPEEREERGDEGRREQGRPVDRGHAARPVEDPGLEAERDVEQEAGADERRHERETERHEPERPERARRRRSPG